MIGTSASEPLRDYADKVGFNVGVAIKESYITSNNATHNNLVKKEFNTIVCENAMKAQNVAPSKNSYDFTIPDQVVNFALANNMKIRGHTLVWYNQNPDWLASGTRQTLLQNMKYHIEKVMSHYKGKLFQWDVVNEAFADNGGEYRPENPYYQIIGEDYIDSAFVYAHNVDPDCKLFINDYNNSYINDKSTALYNKVKRMVDAGIPVHGVGFQCHERSAKKAPDLYKKIRDNFDRFATLGLEIAITEIDIRLWDSTLAVQGEVYATFMKVALDMPECNTFVVWGVRDQDSWVGADQYALLFDNDFKPKPAYDSLNVLLKNVPPIAIIDHNCNDGLKKPELITKTGTALVQKRPYTSMFDLRGVRIGYITDKKCQIPLQCVNKMVLIRSDNGIENEIQVR
jgi:endo-1,4-beta-xylanase